MLLPVRDLWMKKKLRIPGLPGLFIAGHGLFYGIGLHIHKNPEYSQDFGKHGSMQQCDCWDPQDPLNPKMIRYYVPCSGKFSWGLKTRKTTPPHTHHATARHSASLSSRLHLQNIWGMFGIHRPQRRQQNPQVPEWSPPGSLLLHSGLVTICYIPFCF